MIVFLTAYNDSGGNADIKAHDSITINDNTILFFRADNIELLEGAKINCSDLGYYELYDKANCREIVFTSPVKYDEINIIHDSTAKRYHSKIQTII